MVTCRSCGIEKDGQTEFYEARTVNVGKHGPVESVGQRRECKGCYSERRKAQYRAETADDKSARRARAAAWRTKNKTRVAEFARAYRQRHPERVARLQSEENKRRNRRLKLEMLQAYGPNCACCGEAHIEFLTLEHLNGDGKAHRREVGASGVYADLKRRGWPRDGYTVLCMNCNWASRGGRTCPHTWMRTLLEAV